MSPDTLKFEIEVSEPMVKTMKKFDAVVAELAKAMQIGDVHAHEEKTEPTPYLALHELALYLRQYAGAGLRTIFENMVRTWLKTEVQKSGDGGEHEPLYKAVGDDVFKLDGQTYINSQTGQPLTQKEYDAITKDLSRCFMYLFSGTKDAMVKHALAMGKILQSMTPAQAVAVPYEEVMRIRLNTAPTADELYDNEMAFTEQYTAEMLQDISTSARKKVMAIVIDGQRNRITAKKLQSNLFDAFVDLNRDWRRVAETETANNFNNGYIAAELEAHRRAGAVGKPLFVKGITGAGACSFCVDNVKGQVFVLLERAPADGDTVTVAGRTYTAIWPGKSNFGRKRAEWWVSAGTQHPHCRCTFIHYTPGFEETDRMFEEAMNKLNAGNL